MIYINEYISCPRCESKNYTDQYGSDSKSEIQRCNDCGYYRTYNMMKGPNGYFIKDDGTKHFTSEIYVGVETLSKNPFGAFDLLRDDKNGMYGTLETEKDYKEFVADIDEEIDQGKNIKSATVSRYIDGKIIKETIFPKAA